MILAHPYGQDMHLRTEAGDNTISTGTIALAPNGGVQVFYATSSKMFRFYMYVSLMPHSNPIDADD